MEWKSNIDEMIHSLEQYEDLLKWEIKKQTEIINEKKRTLREVRTELKKLKERKKNGLQGH